MFGYWKREAAYWEAHYRRALHERDEREGMRRQTQRERDEARDLARQLRSQLSAADLQLDAERQDNERLRFQARENNAEVNAIAAKLKTTQAGLDHAAHCYEQSELDRQALAKERDEARAERARASKAYTSATRDLERIHLISFEHVTEGTFASPEPTETASAGPDPDREPEAARVPAPDSGWTACPGCFCSACRRNEAACPLHPAHEPDHEANPAPHAPSEPGRCVVCHGGGCQWCLGREPREVGGFATIVANADDPLYPDGP